MCSREIEVVSVFLVLLALWASAPLAEGTLTTLSGYPDLPNPKSNFKTVPSGSLVIPMDTKQYVGGVFNMRAYGLAFHLLHAEVPLYWTIAVGKAKDGADFTAPAHKYSSGSTTSTSFSGGPFVIHKSYVDAAIKVINQNGFSDVVLYVLDANTTIDVRHTLLTRPKALLSDLSGYGSTIVNPLVDAGAVSPPAGVASFVPHQTACQASSIIASLSSSTCFTTFVEPHYVFDTDAPVYFSAVQSYVRSGGNFYAQCASTRSYENTSGGFMSTAGIQQNRVSNTDLLYPQPDLPFTQIIGDIDGSNTGLVTDFYLLNSGTWLANAHAHVVNNPSKATYQGANLTISAATKLTTDISGGLIFYMGGHEWTSRSAALANGRRMYFNALLTPANRPEECGFDFCPTGETCTAGACQHCVCVNNTKFITNATCCSNGVPITCPSPSSSMTPSPSQTSTPSPSVTATPSPSRTPSPSSSITPSPSRTATPSPSLTATPTPSRTPSPSSSITPSPSSSATPSPSPSRSSTPSPSATTSSTPSPSKAADSGLSSGAAAGIAVGAIAGGVAALGAASAIVGAAYLVYRHMNSAAAAAALPTGNSMFVDQAAQTNSLFTESQTEFHNEIYTV